MALISRFINKRLASLLKLNSQPQMFNQFENDYPIEGMGDHYRFYL